MYVRMFRCGHVVLQTTRFFDVAHFTILTPLSYSPDVDSFPIVDLNIFSLPTFALKLIIEFLYGT
jgi:hypothetical protein